MNPGALADLRDQVEMLSRRVRALENNTRELAAPVPAGSIHDVLHAVSAEFSVPVLTITSGRRDREVALARQVAMTLCIQCLNMSVQRVARAFGKDHATVRHAHNAIWAREAWDAKLRNRMNRVRAVFA
jgi:chromosomal replication initiation ATPase DnaA